MKNIFNFISFVFHPLFMALWMIGLLVLIDPVVFFFFNNANSYRIVIIQLLLMLIIPLIFIKLMKEFGVIKDIKLSDRKDRLPAYVIIAMVYLVNYQLLYYIGAPRLLLLAILGMVFVILGLAIINLLFKISAHAAAIGGVIGMLLLYCSVESDKLLYLVVAIIISGVIASSRLYLKAHNNTQLISGLLWGIVGVYFVYMINWLPAL